MRVEEAIKQQLRSSEEVSAADFQRIVAIPAYQNVYLEYVDVVDVNDGVGLDYVMDNWGPLIGPAKCMLYRALRRMSRRVRGMNGPVCYPNEEELGRQVGIKSKTTVREHLRGITKLGLIRRHVGKRTLDPKTGQWRREKTVYEVFQFPPLVPEHASEYFHRLVEEERSDYVADGASELALVGLNREASAESQCVIGSEGQKMSFGMKSWKKSEGQNLTVGSLDAEGQKVIPTEEQNLPIGDSARSGLSRVRSCASEAPSRKQQVSPLEEKRSDHQKVPLDTYLNTNTNTYRYVSKSDKEHGVPRTANRGVLSGLTKEQASEAMSLRDAIGEALNVMQGVQAIKHKSAAAHLILAKDLIAVGRAKLILEGLESTRVRVRAGREGKRDAIRSVGAYFHRTMSRICDREGVKLTLKNSNGAPNKSVRRVKRSENRALQSDVVSAIRGSVQASKCDAQDKESRAIPMGRRHVGLPATSAKNEPTEESGPILAARLRYKAKLKARQLTSVKGLSRDERKELYASVVELVRRERSGSQREHSG